MTNYNVTIKEITSTTAGQGFTIGQGGVISIEFNPTLSTSITNQLPKGDFYLIKFTDENKFMYVPSARFKATFTTSVIVEPEPVESTSNSQPETNSATEDSTIKSDTPIAIEIPTSPQETIETTPSLPTTDSISEQLTLDLGDKNNG